MYKVSLVPTSGVTPLVSCATLTTAQPYASVNLQLQSTYLTITSADNESLSYDETQTYHTFNLTAQSTSLTNTVTVFYQSSQTALPPGWQVIMNSTSLSNGQSTQLVVQTAPYTIAGNVTISVGAVCSSQPLSVTPIVFTQSWCPMIQFNDGTDGSADINFLCYGCRNGGETVQETLQSSESYQSIQCSDSTGPVTLTDALTVPDGAGPAFKTCFDDGVPLTFITAFPNGLSYEFQAQEGTSEAVTITASLLQ